MGEERHRAFGKNGKFGYGIENIYISGSFQIFHIDSEQCIVGPGCAVAGPRGPGLKKASC